MKSCSGMTLISVVVYLIVLIIVLTGIGIMSSFFYNNLYEVKAVEKGISEYNKFNMFFIDDVKESEAVYYDGSEQIVQFSPTLGSSEKIIYKKNGQCIYRNDVKIADNINSFEVTDCNEKDITINISLVNGSSYELKYYLGRGY